MKPSLLVFYKLILVLFGHLNFCRISLSKYRTRCIFSSLLWTSNFIGYALGMKSQVIGGLFLPRCLFAGNLLVVASIFAIGIVV